MYEREKAKVSSVLLSDMLAITTDGWTSRSNCSYVSLTVYYINKDWEMSCHLLETAEIVTDHTAPNLAAGLKDALECWKLLLGKLQHLLLLSLIMSEIFVLHLRIWMLSKLVVFPTPFSWVSRRQWTCQRCQSYIGRAKRLMSHFNHSCKSSYVLHSMQ